MVAVEVPPAEKRKRTLRAVMSLAILAALVGLLVWWGPSAAYAWLKALHVLAIISWMAGMLYLPRLFVYHAQAAIGSAVSEQFKIMEFRLLRYIMNPAMIVAWAVGLWLGYDGGFFSSGWFHGKLLAVALLSGVHGYYAKAVRDFAADRNTRSHIHWRVWNEIPTVLMIAIVILVIVKPF